MGNVIITALLVLTVALIIRSIISDRKAGRHSCGGNCSCCAGACACHRQNKAGEPKQEQPRPGGYNMP